MALKVGELFATLKLDDRDFNKALGNSKASFEGLKSVIGKGTQVAANAFAGTTLAVAGLGLAALKVGLDYNRMQQSSRAALTTLLGSAEAANAQMDKLDDFARNSPFAKQVFITAQQQLLGFGVAAEDVIPTLNAVQNAVAAVGGNNEQVSQVTYALAQMQGQGKLTGETLNQLGQYGIDAATILGKEMGKTGAEIRSLASKPGGIPVDEVFKPLTDGLMKRFGGATDNIKQQMDGAADRIKGAFRDIGSALAEPFIDPKGGGMAVEWTNKVADAMRALETKIKPLVALLQDRFQPQLDLITPALDKVRGAINSWDISKVNGQLGAMTKYAPLIATVATGLFAMGTNVPILASLGLTLNPVVAALGALALTSPQVRDAFGQIFASLQPLLPILAELGIQLANVLVHAIETLAPAVGDLAAGFGEAGVSLLSGLTPALMGLLTAATPLIDVVASLLTFIGGLPTPILAAGLAMAALHGPLNTTVKFISSSALAAFKSLSENMQASKAVADAMGAPMGKIGTAAMTARAGVASLGAALKVAFISSAVGLAIAGIAAAIGVFVSKNAEAAQRVEALRGTLDQTTGAITEMTEASAAAAMQAERGFWNDRSGNSIADDAIKVGIGLDTVRDAMLGNVDAMKAVDAAREADLSRSFESHQDKRVQREMWDNVTNGIKDNAGSLEEAQERQRQMNEILGKGSDAQQDAAEAARLHTEALLGQIDATRAAEDATLSAAEATLRAKEADDRSTEAIQKWKDMADDSTVSAKDKEKALDSAESQILSNVRSYRTHTEAMERDNASSKELDATLKVQRETFIRNKIAIGATADEAEALADSYGLIPNRVESEIILKKAAAEETLRQFRISIGRPVSIPMVATPSGNVVDFAALGKRKNADGGIDFVSYANGKLPDQAIIQSARPGLVQWAEPETGGEAFIPLAPSKRARSVDIWEETGRRLGQFPVRSFANGGFGSRVSAPVPAPISSTTSPRSGPAVVINQVNNNPQAVPSVTQNRDALMTAAALRLVGNV